MDTILKSWSEFTYVLEKISIVTRKVKENYNKDMSNEFNNFYSSIRKLNNSLLNVYYYNKKGNDPKLDLTSFAKTTLHPEEVNNLSDFNYFLTDVKNKIYPCFEYIQSNFNKSTESTLLELIKSINNFKENLNIVIYITNNK
ncbi:MAG: hypothetical protein E7214_05560 [Clostridium sp.]|nr:hypothetical protein [Clostridium sp.]